MTTDQNAEQSNHLARMILHNDYDIYQQFMKIVASVTWDSDEQTWIGLQDAARKLAGYLRGLNPDDHGLSDLRRIDFDAIDYRGLVQDELDEQQA